MKKKSLIMMLILTLCVVLGCGTTSEAAAKCVRSLSVKKQITIEEGSSKKVKVNIKANKKSAKALDVKVKDKKIAKVKYNLKKGTLNVFGLKEGSTKATITTKAKNSRGKKLRKVLTVIVTEQEDDYADDYEDDYYNTEADNNKTDWNTENVINTTDDNSNNSDSSNSKNSNSSENSKESVEKETKAENSITDERTLTDAAATDTAVIEDKKAEDSVVENNNGKDTVTEPESTDTNGEEKGNDSPEIIDISNADVYVVLSKSKYIYSGSPICPEVTVLCNGKIITSDIEVEYENNINAGEARVIITGTGDYCGTITKTFEIEKKSWNIKLDSLPQSICVGETGEIKLKEAHGEMTYTVITEQQLSNIVATVDENGVVTGVEPGRVWVYAKSAGDQNYNEVKNTYLGDMYVCNAEPQRYGFSLKQWSTKARYKSISYPRNDDGMLEFSLVFQCDSSESWIDDKVTFDVVDVTPTLIKQIFSDMNVRSDKAISMDVESHKPYFADLILSPVNDNGVIEYSGSATGAKEVTVKVGQEVRAAKVVAMKDGEIIDSVYVGGEQGAQADLDLYKKVRERVEAKLWTNGMSNYAKLKAVSDYINSTCHYPLYQRNGYAYKTANPTLWNRLNVDGQDIFWGMFSDITMNRIICFQGGIVDCQAAQIITRVAREDLNIPESNELINGSGEAVWLAVGAASSNPGSATHETAKYRTASGTIYSIDTQGMLDKSSCDKHGCLDKIVSLK